MAASLVHAAIPVVPLAERIRQAKLRVRRVKEVMGEMRTALAAEGSSVVAGRSGPMVVVFATGQAATELELAMARSEFPPVVDLGT